MTTDDTRLAEVAAHEDELRFDSFSYDDAWRVGSHIIDLARARGQAVAVSIVFGAQRVFHAALAGTRVENNLWLERKIRTVESYGQSTYRVGLSFRERGADFRTSNWHDPNEYAAFGGGFPIRVGEILVGVAAVSGLAEQDDHALVVEGLRAAR
ncbi:heme-degrading domain-containing protein [Microbacterium sp. MPKO10]|uniref:heme-degrading domain-containing protein n=1 Tax=Microbacterium sp. MPKO10 TaxID=2989818 RepID=UPI0022369AAF|nr:heme-degrading domain-containing protein [Microbacterium sp. MPKO10]MCW4459813.1 heme-degrading domain-containing protein [Microbacterium sp. MPKO10]